MSEDFYTTEIGYEPEIDFDTPEVVLINGNPNLINKYEAIRQWITKFAMTGVDTYEIYAGTGFGNRMKSLYGRKKSVTDMKKRNSKEIIKKACFYALPFHR